VRPLIFTAGAPSTGRMLICEDICCYAAARVS
jgi:hypothetical protein